MKFKTLCFYNLRQGKAAVVTDILVGDTLVMKKNHPCGSNRFLVLRTGVDFKLKCEKCGHEIMTPRMKAEKNVKNVIRQAHGGS